LELSLVNGAHYDPHIGRLLAGQYKVESLLGRGGMGAVYRGVQLSVGRAVAIKLISAGLPDPAQSLQRFRREAEATGSLNHPNTIRLFDFGLTERGEVYMVMELLEGCDLSARLQHGPLPPDEAFHIIRQVLSALSESHARGIVHRDLKPGNVFLSNVHGDPSFVKVMDFGIAGMEQGRDAQKLTVTGAVMGTPAYMSPEQAQGKPVDARGDLYSCGVVLFEMLAGNVPFEADTLVSMLLAHVTQTPKRLAECGVSFPQLAQTQALIDRLLAKSPAQRPSSAVEVVAAIDAIEADSTEGPAPLAHTVPFAQSRLPAPAVTPLGWARHSRAPGSTRKLWIGASVLAIAASALCIVLFLPNEDDKPPPMAADVKHNAPPTRAAELPAAAATPQPAASGAQASAAARTHTEVDSPAIDGAVRETSDTLADVPTAEAVEERDERAEAPARNAKARARTSARSAAGRRSARARAHRRARNAASEEEDTIAEPERTVAPVQAQAFAAPVPANEDVLRRAPPFPSMAAAKRAHDSGKISTSAYEAAVSTLKARRTRRIAIEQQNLSQGKISAQEYEWRLGRIDQEYRGE
jgi:serine/threonine-protein kinase